MAIHGTTREVALDSTFNGRATAPWGGERIGNSAETSIDRKDFGMTWNVALERGGVVVGDTIKISIETEASRVD
jgi:polyisoprenoid-binding protein YceI